MIEFLFKKLNSQTLQDIISTKTSNLLDGTILYLKAIIDEERQDLKVVTIYLTKLLSEKSKEIIQIIEG